LKLLRHFAPAFRRGSQCTKLIAQYIQIERYLSNKWSSTLYVYVRACAKLRKAQHSLQIFRLLVFVFWVKLLTVNKADDGVIERPNSNVQSCKLCLIGVCSYRSWYRTCVHCI